MESFSSREVLSHGTQYVLFVRVPVPEGYVVKTIEDPVLGEVSTPVSFLPPIEISLVEDWTTSNTITHRATVSCGWVSYRNTLRVAGVLDRLWRENAPLEENVQTLLHQGARDILRSLNAEGALDLTWRQPPKPIVKFDPRRKASDEEGEELKRRHKRLAVAVKLSVPKTSSMLPQLVEFNQRELNRGTPTGTSLVSCQGGCGEDVLPTRCRKMQGCEHISCHRCLIGLLRANVNELQFPIPCVYGCEGGIKESNYIQDIIAFDTALHSAVAQAELQMQLSTLTTTYHLHQCPYCKELTRPQCFVEQTQLLLCPHCDECWCAECLKCYEDNQLYGAELKSKCLVSIGRMIFLNQHDLEYLQQLVNVHGFNVYEAAEAAWRHQEYAYHSVKPCPSCFNAIEKDTGCNKMVCWKCKAFFCWSCEKLLDRINPYQHYQNGGCGLVGDGIA